jgi:hypothetical protein
MNADGFCRRHGVDPASLFAIIVPLPGSAETWRVAVEHYLQHAFGLSDERVLPSDLRAGK